jgi:hypothetical protein
VAFYFFANMGNEYTVVIASWAGVVIIYVFQATEIEWGKGHGAILSRASHFSSFLYIDTSRAWWSYRLHQILDCSETSFCSGGSIEEPCCAVCLCGVPTVEANVRYDEDR